jgi:hypothetical protein
LEHHNPPYFEGKTGADPALLNQVHDKERLVVAATESGYINTELKFEWYRRCRAFPACPFGKRPTIPQDDSHASNESVEMSAMMELEDEAFLVAPSGHSTHLTQQLDKTGGPIQHFKRIMSALIRHYYRAHLALEAVQARDSAHHGARVRFVLHPGGVRPHH